MINDLVWAGWNDSWSSNEFISFNIELLSIRRSVGTKPEQIYGMQYMQSNTPGSRAGDVVTQLGLAQNPHKVHIQTKKVCAPNVYHHVQSLSTNSSGMVGFTWLVSHWTWLPVSEIAWETWSLVESCVHATACPNNWIPSYSRTEPV